MRVIEYRADPGLSQHQLADQVGLSVSQVARLKTGEQNPAPEAVARLAVSGIA